MKIRKSGSWILVFLLWAVTPAALFGQNTTGKIAGLVSDNTGASVPGCTVTLTNLDTAESNTITTDSSGILFVSQHQAGALQASGREERVQGFRPTTDRCGDRKRTQNRHYFGGWCGHRDGSSNRSDAFTPAGDELAGASHRPTSRHRYAPQRPQPDCLNGNGARRCAAGPAFGRKLVDRQPGRRQSVRAGRFSDWRRPVRSKPDSD